MVGAGADAVWIHARKAWLQGLSPKENRDIPPLDYPLVYRMKRENPDVFLGINGGIPSVEAAVEHLRHMDGVMIGRAAYHHAAILGEVDAAIYGETVRPVDWDAVRDAMIAYAERHMARGGRLSNVTRHMVGLFQSVPGARRFRQILSTGATKPDARPELIAEAFAAVDLSGERAAAE
jgi:tRNA-dihydrouridine synthase A